MSLLGILIALLVWIIIGGLLYYVVSLLPLPEPFKTIVTVVVLLILVVILLSLVVGWIPIPKIGGLHAQFYA